MSKKKQQSEPEQPPAREPDVELVGNLAKDALNPRSDLDHDQIKAQIDELNPEEAGMFLHILELTLKRRRLQLIGYICAFFAVVGGMVLSLFVWANREPGQFVGWVFVVPPAAAALCIWLFGRWSNRIR